MADQPLKVVRVDSGEPASKPPLQLASLPWVGPAGAPVEAEPQALAGFEDDPSTLPPDNEPPPSPTRWDERTEADARWGINTDTPAIAGRTYRRVDPPEQMSLASERERHEAEPSHRRSGPQTRASRDQNANASVSVALIVAAAIGMGCWMAYGPGRTTPELVPSDALLLGSSDLAPVSEPEEPPANDAAEHEPALEAPDSPANSIEVEPLSSPASPTASEPQRHDPVADLAPTSLAPPSLAPPSLAAPPLETKPKRAIESPALVVEAPPEPQPQIVKPAAVDKPAESRPAGYVRTAFRDIDNRSIDFRRFRPPAAPRPQPRPAKTVGPLFHP